MDTPNTTPDALDQQKEIEVKYLVNPEKLPDDLRDALLKGKEHDDILRKGRITQLYLPIEAKTVALALAAIQATPDKPLSDEDLAFFCDPQNIAEIRILQREQDHIPEAQEAVEAHFQNKGALIYPDAFQITLKGHPNVSGTVRRNVETPITVDPQVAQAVVGLLEHLNEDTPMAWQGKVKTVEKMWYDLRIQDPEFTLKTYTAELDVFPDLEYLGVVEVECADEESLQRFQTEVKPDWFETDITRVDAFKVRNLAGKSFEELDPEVHRIMGALRENLQKLYLPTVLGNEVQKLPEETAQEKFVVLGSFKRWLPQFRRIVQDLLRSTGGVYPPISTLDIARRHVATNDPKAAFRIEAELVQDPRKPEGTLMGLKRAEMNYLKRINEADAVYVVAPERRLGESSGYEAVYAAARKKKLYIANNIDRVSEEIILPVQIILQWVIKAILDNQEDLVFSQTEVGNIINFHVGGMYSDKVQSAIAVKSLLALLRGSAAEDQRRKEIEATEKEEQGI